MLEPSGPGDGLSKALSLGLAMLSLHQYVLLLKVSCVPFFESYGPDIGAVKYTSDGDAGE